MKRLYCAVLILFLLYGIKSYSQNIDPYANIVDSWIVDNVIVDDKEGLEIHLKIDIFNHGTYEANVLVLFFLEDGSILKDFNGQYVVGSNQVAVSTTFTPQSSESSEDIVLFIPYNELHIRGAKANLKCMSIIYDYEWKQMAVSDYISFYINSDDFDK